jgi:hypothetical protein
MNLSKREVTITTPAADISVTETAGTTVLTIVGTDWCQYVIEVDMKGKMEIYNDRLRRGPPVVTLVGGVCYSV